MHSEIELPASYPPAALQIQLSNLREFIDSQSVKIHRAHLPLKALSVLNKLQMQSTTAKTGLKEKF